MIPFVLLFVHSLNAVADSTGALPQVLHNTNTPTPLFTPTLYLDPQIISTRSRSDIIWSCFATIFACTWVAVHPNVPAPKDSEWKVLRHRLKIMVYTLLVPELVLYWASKQWYAASQTAKKHKDKGWTVVHGFFIGMGGLFLSEEGSPLRPLDLDYLEDAVDLGMMEWPEISEEDILDKSNGDYFTKGVVVLQTGWFIVQCIARGVVRLPLTELEVITLAYAVLSGAMYFFWWNKPLDVRRSIIIYGKNSGKLEFVSSTDSERNGSHANHLLGSHASFASPIFSRTQYPGPEHSHSGRRHSLSSLSSTKSSVILEIPACHTLPTSKRTRERAQFSAQPTSALVENSATSESPSSSTTLSSATLRRPGRSLENRPYKEPRRGRSGYLSVLIYPFQEFMNDCEEMKESGSLSSGGSSPFYAGVRLQLDHALSILLFLLGTVFGAMHCIAWSSEFPSTVEEWMWKGAAVGVLVLPSMIAANYLIAAWLFSSRFPGLRFGRFNFTFSLHGLRLLASCFLELTSSARLMILFGLYIMSRIVLLILPLVELRSLPFPAYQSIDWTGFIPHL